MPGATDARPPRLPVVSGFEVLEWIRAQPEFANLPVMIFSSSSREEDKKKARHLGANDYWEKPNSPLRFSKVVQAMREKWLELSGTAGANRLMAQQSGITPRSVG